jgi:hypothetical protein
VLYGFEKPVTIRGMKKSRSRKSLLDGYRVPGFRTHSRIKGRFGDKSALVITLSRRQKKRYAANVERSTGPIMTAARARRETSAPVDVACSWNSSNGGWTASGVAP